MKTVDITQAPTILAEYAQGPGGEPAIVTANGNPVAALLPIESADLETVSLATNAQFLALIERSRARHRSEGGISSAAMRQRFADG
jgi:antitoxin (DNA-binding transcriptional repressor) of toxin-antitoxin stability system